MYRNDFNYPNEERFLGPVIPFLGGALIGYVASRPNFTNAYMQPYYPVYYNPYPTYTYTSYPPNGMKYNIN